MQEDVDTGALITAQTDCATLCSRGIHHLVFKEEVGTVCKYCSHVEREIRYILPSLVSHMLVPVSTFDFLI